MDEGVRHRWLRAVHARVASAGLRAGSARIGVIELLAREGQCLIDARTIVDRLRAEGGSGSQASVYRILDELCALGLVRREADPHGVARYEIVEAGSRHHHFHDVRTGDVEPFVDPELDAVIVSVAGRLGVELQAHEVRLHGTRRPGEAAL